MAQESTEIRADGKSWIGDLSSAPQKDRVLWDQEVHALHFIIQSGNCPPSDIPTMYRIIADRQEMLRAELAEPRVQLLSELLKGAVHHQLRARADFRQEQIAVEQWVPAHGAWMVAGYFDWDTPSDEIIYQLRRGDPRFKSMNEAYEEAKAASAARRKEIDAASTQKVLGAVDSLTAKSRDQFIAVEEAMKTGETIIAHGDDARKIEAGLDLTKKAARAGDVESQQVLTRGQSDNALCVNPGHNPTRR